MQINKNLASQPSDKLVTEVKSMIPNFEQSTALFAQHFSIIWELRKSVVNFKNWIQKDGQKGFEGNIEKVI